VAKSNPRFAVNRHKPLTKIGWRRQRSTVSDLTAAKKQPRLRAKNSQKTPENGPY
jgi:hypothetical protein